MALKGSTNVFQFLYDKIGKRRHGRQTNSQGTTGPNTGNTVLTITLICFVFVASYTPLIVSIVLRNLKISIPGWYDIFFTHSLSLNITFNPLIYAATNKRFRQYMIEKLRIDSSEYYEEPLPMPRLRPIPAMAL
eukprot:sb/3474838/